MPDVVRFLLDAGFSSPRSFRFIRHLFHISPPEGRRGWEYTARRKKIDRVINTPSPALNTCHFCALPPSPAAPNQSRYFVAAPSIASPSHCRLVVSLSLSDCLLGAGSLVVGLFLCRRRRYFADALYFCHAARSSRIIISRTFRPFIITGQYTSGRA